MEALYVAVDRAGVPVRVRATSSSIRPQLVRISGSYRAGKTSRIGDIRPLELRPRKQSPAALDIPPWSSSYWLSIRVFSQTDAGWSRSAPERIGPLLIPQNGLVFLNRGSTSNDCSVVLNLSYPCP